MVYVCKEHLQPMLCNHIVYAAIGVYIGKSKPDNINI